MRGQLRAAFGPFAGATTMLDSDPPVHTRLRRLVSRAFTSRRIKEIEPRIHAIANELLDRIGREGSFDLMNDFAGPLYFLPGDQNVTVQLALYTFSGQSLSFYNLLFMAIFIITIPPLIGYIFFNRQIVAGLTAGAVKG